MPGWNFADVWETVAEARGDAPAQVQGDRRFTWSEMDRRADAIAKVLVDSGLRQQDKVAQYLYNCPTYLESMFGIFKAGLVPVNTNYRYRADELVYLWDNADARAVVFHGAFTETIDEIRDRVRGVRLWLWVDDGSGPCPGWAVPYEDAASLWGGRLRTPWGRSGDDIYMLYTGGTTGMPKGVMWRQHDLYSYLKRSALNEILGVPEDPDDADLDAVRRRCERPGPVSLPACPLMHGTGGLTAMSALRLGGSVVTLTERRLDVVEMLDAIEREGVQLMAIVGDPFARPMLHALDDEPDRWDISSLVLINSSGAMWSEETKQGLLGHHPGMALSDGFSSSEALGMGRSVSRADGVVKTASFELGPKARVITPEGKDVEPGEVGMVAVGGPQPIGYYKDPEKTERTFRVIDGERYSIPGDFATIEADGTIKLLGRGNVCINTGGEKVFPEEVEEALKEHPSVHDALVVGVPDERFGEAVTGVVELGDGATASEDELIATVKERLAGYKAPKRVVFVDTIGRAPSGKADYKRVKAEAMELLGIGVPSSSRA